MFGINWVLVGSVFIGLILLRFSFLILLNILCWVESRYFVRVFVLVRLKD